MRLFSYIEKKNLKNVSFQNIASFCMKHNITEVLLIVYVVFRDDF